MVNNNIEEDSNSRLILLINYYHINYQLSSGISQPNDCYTMQLAILEFFDKVTQSFIQRFIYHQSSIERVA